MDLGISSFQLMEPNKGFPFADAPIDMRLDPRVGQSAADLWRLLRGKPRSGGA